MDKVEYRELIRSIKNKYLQQDYEGVIDVADQIDPEKIRENSILEMIADSYEKLGRYDLARETLLIAYKKTPTGKRMAYNLSLLSIKLDDLDGAVMFYEDFCKMAPRDNQRLLLKYEIGKAGGVPGQNLARVLEQYNSREMDEKWLYELARLYHEMGDDEKCASTCDQIILWYANGDYEKKALELKNMHKSLTASQQARYEEIMKNILPAAYTGADLENEEQQEEEQPEQDITDETVSEQAEPEDIRETAASEEEPEVSIPQTEEEQELQPAEEESELQPEAEEQESQPIEEESEPQPVEEEQELQSAQEESEPQPVEDEQEQPSAQDEQEQQLTWDEADLQPVHEEQQPAVEEQEPQLVEDEQELEPAQEESEPQPVEEEQDQHLSDEIQSTDEADESEEDEAAEPEQENEAEPSEVSAAESAAAQPAVETEPGNIEGQMSLFAMFEAFKNQTIEDREQMNRIGEDRAAQIMAEVNSSHDSSELSMFEEEDDDSSVEEVIEPEVPILNREDIIEPVDDGGVDIGEREAEFAFEKPDEPEEKPEETLTREQSVDATQYIPVDQIKSRLADELRRKGASDDYGEDASVIRETDFYSEIDPGRARKKVKIGASAQEREYDRVTADDFEPGRQITQAERAIIAYETSKMLKSQESDGASEFNINELIGSFEPENREETEPENDAASVTAKETKPEIDAGSVSGKETEPEEETVQQLSEEIRETPEEEVQTPEETQESPAAEKEADDTEKVQQPEEKDQEPVLDVIGATPADERLAAFVAAAMMRAEGITGRNTAVQEDAEEPETEIKTGPKEYAGATVQDLTEEFLSQDEDFAEETVEETAEETAQYEDESYEDDEESYEDTQRAMEDAVLNMGRGIRPFASDKSRNKADRKTQKKTGKNAERKRVRPAAAPEPELKTDEEQTTQKKVRRGNAPEARRRYISDIQEAQPETRIPDNQEVQPKASIPVIPVVPPVITAPDIQETQPGFEDQTWQDLQPDEGAGEDKQEKPGREKAEKSVKARTAGLRGVFNKLKNTGRKAEKPKEEEFEEEPETGSVPEGTPAAAAPAPAVAAPAPVVAAPAPAPAVAAPAPAVAAPAPAAVEPAPVAAAPAPAVTEPAPVAAAPAPAVAAPASAVVEPAPVVAEPAPAAAAPAPAVAAPAPAVVEPAPVVAEPAPAAAAPAPAVAEPAPVVTEPAPTPVVATPAPAAAAPAPAVAEPAPATETPADSGSALGGVAAAAAAVAAAGILAGALSGTPEETPESTQEQDMSAAWAAAAIGAAAAEESDQWYEEDEMLTDPDRISRSVQTPEEPKGAKGLLARTGKFFGRKPKETKELEDDLEQQMQDELPQEEPEAVPAEAGSETDTEKKPVPRGNLTPEQREARLEAKRLKSEAKAQAKEEKAKLKAEKALEKQKAREEAQEQDIDLNEFINNPDDKDKQTESSGELDLDALLNSSIKASPETDAVKTAVTADKPAETLNIDDLLSATIKTDETVQPAQAVRPVQNISAESLDDILNATILATLSPARETSSDSLDDFLNSTINPNPGPSKKEEIMSGLDEILNSINPDIKDQNGPILETTKLTNILSTLKAEVKPAAQQQPISFDQLLRGGRQGEEASQSGADGSDLKLSLDKKYRLSRQQRKDLGEFLMIEGMDEAICDTIEKLVTRKKSGDETGGHMIVTGDAKTGKTFLAVEILKAVNEETGHGNPRVAKVQAQAINGRNVRRILQKVEDSDLIIENIEKLEDDTVRDLISAIRESNAPTMVILEGNEMAADNIILKFPEIKDIFKTRINIGELTLTQWADAALFYAMGQGYSIEGVALLALHARIDEINTPDIRLGYAQVRKVVDDAIEKAEKRIAGKLFSAFSRKNEDELIPLLEEDFM